MFFLYPGQDKKIKGATTNIQNIDVIKNKQTNRIIRGFHFVSLEAPWGHMKPERIHSIGQDFMTVDLETQKQEERNRGLWIFII